MIVFCQNKKCKYNKRTTAKGANSNYGRCHKNNLNLVYIDSEAAEISGLMIACSESEFKGYDQDER